MNEMGLIFSTIIGIRLSGPDGACLNTIAGRAV